MADQTLSRGWDHLGAIARTLGDLQGARTVVHELIQNADDAPGATRMRFTITDAVLEVWNDGEFSRCNDVATVECTWFEPEGHRCDFHSFRKISSGDKRNRAGNTGAFGIGFTTVYQITDQPELMSNGEHWIVNEIAAEADRIRRRSAPKGHVGTTFRLPWASTTSELRTALRQEPVGPDTIASLTQEVFDEVPRSMPFLRQLDTIQIDTPAGTVTFERLVDDDRVAVGSNAGIEAQWIMVRGTFEPAARDLIATHTGVLNAKRSPTVSVGYPVDDERISGLLYATLPTEEVIGLPVVIDASFYPASDRKRIRFDHAPEGDWNRAAIRAAAGAIAESLPRLPVILGDERLVALLAAAKRMSGQPAVDGHNPGPTAFWEAILRELPTAVVVPVQNGGHGQVGMVRLWGEPAEVDAAPVLRSLGIELVGAHVKDQWYGLRSADVPIQELTLGHLVEALRTHGLTQRHRVDDLPPALRTDEGLDQMWALLHALLRLRGRSNRQSKEALMACAVAPGWDGALWPIHATRRLDQASQDLFADAGVEATFLDEDRLGGTAPSLVELIPKVEPHEAIRWLEMAFDDVEHPSADVNRTALLKWFHERRSELTSEDRRHIANLPLFPTASGPRPLPGLALPGDFQDPLGLARLVQVTEIEELRGFLQELGAAPLTFASYCTDHLAEAVTGDSLTEDERRRALSLLARRLSEIQDTAGVKATLHLLPLVPCTDGTWRAGSEVYLTGAVIEVLGADVHIAELPTDNRSAHESLYQWLGVASDPRPGDIIDRGRALAAGPKEHREIAQAIISHLGMCFKADSDHVKTNFGRLREVSWLPVEGSRGRGHRPDKIFTTFRRHIFSTQGQFLDLPPAVQRNNAELLHWLGLRDEPEPKQVVDHLLKCSSASVPVNVEVWRYLDNRADDPALDDLKQTPCLLVAKRDEYVRPSDVYWGDHPFGRWRYALGSDFRNYQALLDRLGVSERPHPLDAIDVLLDIAVRHGGEKRALLDEDVPVVHGCWRLLSQGLDAGLVPTVLEELTNAEVVLDSRSWLRRPTEVFFRDSVSLASHFDEEVAAHLVDRPEGRWPALAAAGVRNLSDAVSTELVEQEQREGKGSVPLRLQERRDVIMRVISHIDGAAATRLDRFWTEVTQERMIALRIVQTVEIAGRTHSSEPYDRGALYRDDVPALLYVDRDDSEPTWVEIAKELGRAVDIKIDGAAAATSAVTTALTSSTLGEAIHALDECGFPDLARSVLEVAEPRLAERLVGADDGPPQTGLETTEFPHAGAPGTTGSDPAPAPTGHDGTTVADEEARAAGAPSAEGPPEHNRTAAIPSVDEREPGTAAAPDGSTPAGDNHPLNPRPIAPRLGSSQTRLRSYVIPAKTSTEPCLPEEPEADAAVERAAVDAVVHHERSHGRDPEEMPPHNEGYDVRSVEAGGVVRYIEIKGTAATWGATGVALSSAQYEMARTRGDEFWLYVVDRALTRPQVHAIRNPARRVDQYVFDGGWSAIEEPPETTAAALPDLRIPDVPDGIPRAVPLCEIAAGGSRSTTGWVPCALAGRTNEWFAVRVLGESLGLANRGGIAFIEPMAGPPEADDRVLVILHGQDDPDTGSPVALRLWAPELDLTGRQLALRLRSNGSTEPITVDDPDRITVLGSVAGGLSITDLQELGYL